ncbi:MAG: hypothetical protein ACKO96_21090, partial [Flammeovirgaceae bacterium]
KIVEAFHRPAYRVSLNSTINIYNKVILDADVLAQGGMKGLSTEFFVPSGPRKVIDIPSAFDVNLKANYLVSNQFSVFVSCNNILNNNYQMYLYYPVRGFQAMVGASFSF